MLARNRLGDRKVASSVILTLAQQDMNPLGQYFFSLRVCLKAKGYIKVQVIRTCMWLWESPTRPLGLCAVCLHDPPHSLTIYVADDSSPWSSARAQWGQASGAMAAPLALHQNPGKISLGTVAGCLLLRSPSGARNTFGTAAQRCRHEVGAKAVERRFSQEQAGKTGRATETREGGCGNSDCASFLRQLDVSDRRQLRFLTFT